MSYITLEDAQTLAATMLNLPAWTAADEASQTAALLEAADIIDNGGPWQGRKYDPDQAHEFPRVVDETTMSFLGGGMQTSYRRVWDWNKDTNAAIVPPAVLKAVLIEADAILSGERAQRRAAIHDGLASQSVGGVSETYINSTGSTASGANILSERSEILMRKYRLRTGILV